MSAIYSHVTDAIIKSLEAGAAPWIRPWSESGKASSPWGLPYNCTNGREYRGSNILILWGVAKDRGYLSHGWLTLKQANALGGTIRKGERATWVNFYLWREDPKEPGKRFPTLKAYRVFNVEQCEGLPESILQRAEVRELDQGAIEARVRSLGVRVRLGGNRAYYQPSEDRIAVPLPGQFKSREAFYSVLMHECTHATGAAHRLDRNLTGHFGDQSYAAEELIAEMGAAFACARFGIALEGLQHPEYLASWLKVLRSDSRAIMRAASAAQKACDLIMGTEFKPEGDGEPVPQTEREVSVTVGTITQQPNREIAGILTDFAIALFEKGQAVETERATAALLARLARPKARRVKGLPEGWQRHPVTGWAMRVPEGRDVRDLIPYGRDAKALEIVAKHYRTHARIGAANVLTLLEQAGEDTAQYRAGLMSRRREAGMHRYNYGPGKIDPANVLESNQGMGRVRFIDETARAPA